MRRHFPFSSPLIAALTIAFGSMLLTYTAHAQAVSKTAMAGAYSVTLRVLPPEAFQGAHAPMERDARAKPNSVNGPKHPNHHLVAFVKENGKPVEMAKVSIRYRELSPKHSGWKTVPVVRMHVAGKSLATTHYGNNVDLPPGNYEAQVTVNGSAPATVKFTLEN
jgi:hypothetical protein